MSIFKQIIENLAGSQQSETDIRYTDQPFGTDSAGNYAPEFSDPETFDMGTLPDQATNGNYTGWPDQTIQTVPLTDSDVYPAPAQRPPWRQVRRWYAETVTFAAGVTQPRLISPSGIDSQTIISITVNGHADNFYVGPDENNARIGFLIPLNRPITFGTGPMWCYPPSAGGSIAIAVEYECHDE